MVVDIGKQRTVTETYRTSCASSAPPSTTRRALEGGNQTEGRHRQWLATGARIFCLTSPARHRRRRSGSLEVMDELARNGAAILMVSSELKESPKSPTASGSCAKAFEWRLPPGASQKYHAPGRFEKESGLLPDSEK